MRFKIVLLSTILLSLSATLFARPLVDSVGIENLNGKKVILHKLDPKDNYYSIGRKYGVSPKAIISFNNNAGMQIGKIIKVPTERPFDGSEQAAATPPQNKPVTQPQQNKPVTQQPIQTQTTQTQPVTTTVTPPPVQNPVEQKAAQQVANSNANGISSQQYKVSAGETLYSIAKRFNTTVEDITATNKLTESIKPGQLLTIRSNVPPPPTPAAVANDSLLAKRDSTMVAPADTMGEHRPGTNKYGLFEKNERGVATWIEDTSLDPNKKLILHRTAPIGTIMRISNPMTGKSTFAKVVGRFTDNQQTKDVVIVMTKNVADSIGALDKRFHVNISYGTPNE
ncbi:LysM peptidoglycan-binding domain-containing protein [Mucilaginibacter terrenus]|uniref:LysM peptidoglycan-binding domain-containing protein n=1 Tax=Mucilaginibacter terrenus TaxID=2482727 RepID=A0A3E2NT95_9SPHI|nr:LysM peptidoglycan-binding domain-containing protein [Mucilaginibacter terrenus]RFZ84189.1 LysM peptidoglycan-binding domain-containing protein [Mucilaginibacter terrenus]